MIFLKGVSHTYIFKFVYKVWHSFWYTHHLKIPLRICNCFLSPSNRYWTFNSIFKDSLLLKKAFILYGSLFYKQNSRHELWESFALISNNFSLFKLIFDKKYEFMKINQCLNLSCKNWSLWGMNENEFFLCL